MRALHRHVPRREPVHIRQRVLQVPLPVASELDARKVDVLGALHLVLVLVLVPEHQALGLAPRRLILGPNVAARLRLVPVHGRGRLHGRSNRVAHARELLHASAEEGTRVLGVAHVGGKLERQVRTACPSMMRRIKGARRSHDGLRLLAVFPRALRLDDQWSLGPVECTRHLQFLLRQGPS